MVIKSTCNRCKIQCAKNKVHNSKGKSQAIEKLSSFAYLICFLKVKEKQHFNLLSFFWDPNITGIKQSYSLYTRIYLHEYVKKIQDPTRCIKTLVTLDLKCMIINLILTVRKKLTNYLTCLYWQRYIIMSLFYKYTCN